MKCGSLKFPMKLFLVILRVSYCSVIPWVSLTQSFCSLSDRTVTLVGGGVPGLLYTLCGPGGSSRLNLPQKTKCLHSHWLTASHHHQHGEEVHTGRSQTRVRFHSLDALHHCQSEQRCSVQRRLKVPNSWHVKKVAAVFFVQLASRKHV